MICLVMYYKCVVVFYSFSKALVCIYFFLRNLTFDYIMVYNGIEKIKHQHKNI